MRIGPAASTRHRSPRRDSLRPSAGSVADTRVHVHHVGGNSVNQQVSCLERGCANLRWYLVAYARRLEMSSGMHSPISLATLLLSLSLYIYFNLIKLYTHEKSTVHLSAACAFDQLFITDANFTKCSKYDVAFKTMQNISREICFSPIRGSI